jgi:hypothetical protein
VFGCKASILKDTDWTACPLSNEHWFISIKDWTGIGLDYGRLAVFFASVSSADYTGFEATLLKKFDYPYS